MASSSRKATGFQSAPALCRAGDQALPPFPSRARSFNPRPLFAERATRTALAFCRRSTRFNPRPLFAERATRCASILRRDELCFNPRPLFAERATLPHLRSGKSYIRFNPRPLFAERATPRCQVVVAKADGRHFARTRVAASHDDTATRHAEDCGQAARCAAPCANLPALRRRTGFARQTTSGPSKSVARKRPYSLTRSSVGSVMR